MSKVMRLSSFVSMYVLHMQGCDKGDRCRFAHVSEEQWSGSDRGRFNGDRGEHREDRERDRSQ